MSGKRQISMAVLMALISGALVLGSISLSFLESAASIAPGSIRTPVGLLPGEPILNLVTRVSGELTIETVIAPIIGQIATAVPTDPAPALPAVPALPAGPTNSACPPPAGWQVILTHSEHPSQPGAHL